jgi:hypothetical protein
MGGGEILTTIKMMTPSSPLKSRIKGNRNYYKNDVFLLF